jgi:hypothetical protein
MVEGVNMNEGSGANTLAGAKDITRRKARCKGQIL